MRRALILTTAVSAVAAPPHAQIAVGNLYGTLADAASRFDRIEEILSPRILRFGARVSF